MLKKMLMTVVLSSNVLVLTGAEMYDAAYKAGREAEKNNDFPAAIEAYQEAAELAGENEAVKAAMLCHQAEAQRRAKQYDNAIATYRKVLEVEKGGVNEKGLSQLNIGTCLMLQGKYQEAIAEYEKVMSQEFHLYACIFRIHWFDPEFLGTDDLNFLILFIILIKVCLLEVCGFLLLVNDLVLVFTKLTLNYLFNQIDGYIHIIAYLLGTDNVTFHRDRYLDLLAILLNA